MGYSRDSFHGFKTLRDAGGEAAQREIGRRKPSVKNRVAPAAEQAALDFARERPACGRLRASAELRKRGVFVSPGGVRRIWLRHDLAAFKGRLKAPEARMAQEGIAPAESQLAAMGRASQLSCRVPGLFSNAGLFAGARCWDEGGGPFPRAGLAGCAEFGETARGVGVRARRY